MKEGDAEEDGVGSLHGIRCSFTIYSLALFSHFCLSALEEGTNTVTAVLPLHYVTGDLNPNKLLL